MLNPLFFLNKTVVTSSAPNFLTMEDPLVTFETTSKGYPMVRDSNNYTYVANVSSTEVKYWKCSVKMCSARIRTRIRTVSELDL